MNFIYCCFDAARRIAVTSMQQLLTVVLTLRRIEKWWSVGFAVACSCSCTCTARYRVRRGSDCVELDWIGLDLIGLEFPRSAAQQRVAIGFSAAHGDDPKIRNPLHYEAGLGLQLPLLQHCAASQNRRDKTIFTPKLPARAYSLTRSNFLPRRRFYAAAQRFFCSSFRRFIFWDSRTNRCTTSCVLQNECLPLPAEKRKRSTGAVSHRFVKCSAPAGASPP